MACCSTPTNRVYATTMVDSKPIPVALTINGFGVKYYGKADLWPDGTFVQTKWIVVLFVPLIPLGSYRVLSERRAISGWGEVGKEFSQIKVPLHWRQVFTAYAIVVAILLGFPSLINSILGR